MPTDGGDVGLAGTNHVNLTVTDLDRSTTWYEEVFGIVVVSDEEMCPPATDSPIRYRSLFDLESMSYVVGLIEHPDGEPGRFDERRAGLDHFAVHVTDSEDLLWWVEHLDALAIEHSGIKRFEYEDAITFRDPDNIQLEVCWPKMSFWAAKLTARLGQ